MIDQEVAVENVCTDVVALAKYEVRLHAFLETFVGEWTPLLDLLDQDDREGLMRCCNLSAAELRSVGVTWLGVAGTEDQVLVVFSWPERAWAFCAFYNVGRLRRLYPPARGSSQPNPSVAPGRTSSVGSDDPLVPPQQPDGPNSS